MNRCLLGPESVFWPARAAAAAAAKPVVEAQLFFFLGLQRSVPRKNQCAQFLPVKLDFMGPVHSIVQSVGYARPPGFVECSGTESELAEFPGDEDETGSSWSRANGTPFCKVDGAQLLGIARCSATTESVPAVSSVF